MTTTASEIPGLSPTLLAATTEQGNYACGLSNGLTVSFASATYQSGSDWITLMPLAAGNSPSGVSSTIFSDFPDGIDVRLDSIVWTATNPATQMQAV